MTQIKILREQATHRIEMDPLRNSIVKTRQNWERNFNQRTDLKSRHPWSQLTQAERPFPTPPRARCSPRPYLLLGRGPRRGQSPRNIWVVSDINKSNFPRFFSLRHLKNCRSGPGTTKIFLPCRDWKCCRGPRPAPFFFRPPTDHPSRRFQPAAGAACSSDKHTGSWVSRFQCIPSIPKNWPLYGFTPSHLNVASSTKSCSGTN